jgi:hypothetical protein
MLTNLRRWARRLRPGNGHDEGQALLFVLVALALLFSIPLAIATTTVNQLPETSRNLNWDAAYEAAQAGLNDYMQHIDADVTYTRFTTASPDGSNQAFGHWVQASTTPLEYYSYAPTIQSGGLVSLKVSGKSGAGATAVVRNFSFTIRPISSLDYVYWSNYETIDPAIDNNVSGCGYHYLEPNGSGGKGPNNGGSTPCVVVFNTGDVLDGPVFSNDTFYICGTPTFESQVQSGNIYAPATTIDVKDPANGGCGFSPNFSGITPEKVGNQAPPTTQADVTPAQTYGCYYNGNVTIAMTSPSSGNTNITVSGIGVTTTKIGGNTNTCPVGSSFALSAMTSGLIYVNGTVSISGAMSGLLDVVSTSNITVTNNISYPSANINASTGTDAVDAMGLIAKNSVIVNEVSNMTIDAAILALSDSFYVKNWTSGYYNTLTVFGAIAQNYRGPVGTFGGGGGSTGYTKSYQYDSSLETLWPPYFLPPNGATWSPSSYSELCSGFTYSVLGTKTSC